MYLRLPYDDIQKTNQVYSYLESKNVPIGVKNIAKNTSMTKKQVLAICHNHEGITRVHPEYYGSGRFKGSVFVASTDKKYKFVPSFYLSQG